MGKGSSEDSPKQSSRFAVPFSSGKAGTRTRTTSTTTVVEDRVVVAEKPEPRNRVVGNTPTGFEVDGMAKSGNEGDSDALDDARKGRRRSRTIPMRQLTRDEILQGAELTDLMAFERPKTRSECAQGIRPCPFVSCRHHLYLEVNEKTGSIKLNFPDLDVHEMKETCALDVADRGGVTLEEIGEILNLTRERIRQLESKGLELLRTLGFSDDFRDMLEEDGK